MSPTIAASSPDRNRGSAIECIEQKLVAETVAAEVTDFAILATIATMQEWQQGAPMPATRAKTCHSIDPR